MPSPMSNGTPVTTFSTSGRASWLYLAEGAKWGGALGTGVTLTYSFPGTGPGGSVSYVTAYGGSYFNEWWSASTLSAGEQAAVVRGLQAWANVANVKFTKTADTTASVGELRFTYSREIDGAAHAYTPSESAEAGDVWFNWYDWNPTGASKIARGSYDHLAVIHEIGHALGLKHSFEGPNAMPRSLDNMFNTIMSYTASPWSTLHDNYASFYPTTPMYYDLLAMQAIYGKNTSYASGNTTYTFNDGSYYFQCIYDTGGSDTIVYNGVEGSTINLNPGAFSSVSEAITFSTRSSRATVSIGPDVDIERAIGGSGNDRLIGTNDANILSGRAGNDTLDGRGGNDSLYGSSGRDILSGGAGLDTFLFNTGLSDINIDVIRDFMPVDDTIKLENAVFLKLASTGALRAAYFHVGAAAADTNDYIIYNKSTGALYYDADGNKVGGDAAVQFATISNKASLTSADFVIV